jgi:transposase
MDNIKRSDSISGAPRVSLGIDVSKATLDCHFLPESGHPAFGQFPNDQTGHVKLLKWAKRLAGGGTIHFCMEATGSYGDAIALFLAEADQIISVINPYRIHHWAISRGLGNKTDKVDAKAIARYCLNEKPAVWRMAAPEVRELTALVRHLDNVKQHATQQKNRLAEPNLPPLVIKSLKTLLKQIEAQIASMDKIIEKHINNHPTLKGDRDLLVTIPGIAATTAAKLLAELPDVNQFACAQSAAKYAGLSPSQYESGSSIHKKTKLFKAGKRRLKATLYMPAMTAIRYNQPVKQIYQRLIGKGHKGASALAAAMRKLLMIAVGVLRSQTPFQADYAKMVKA